VISQGHTVNFNKIGKIFNKRTSNFNRMSWNVCMYVWKLGLVANLL